MSTDAEVKFNDIFSVICIKANRKSNTNTNKHSVSFMAKKRFEQINPTFIYLNQELSFESTTDQTPWFYGQGEGCWPGVLGAQKSAGSHPPVYW